LFLRGPTRPCRSLGKLGGVSPKVFGRERKRKDLHSQERRRMFRRVNCQEKSSLAKGAAICKVFGEGPSFFV